jgi:hypothetical protein
MTQTNDLPGSAATESPSPGIGSITTTENTTVPARIETTRAVLEARRRERVIAEDRWIRRNALGIAALATIPTAGLPFMPAQMSDMMAIVIAMIMMMTIVTVPLGIIWSMIPSPERRRLKKGVPTYVPPAPRLEDGTMGPEWNAGQVDVIFGRTDHLVDAIDRRAPDEEVDQAVRMFAMRASELVEGRSVLNPSHRSDHHYWPNKHTAAGAQDGDTIVSYDDNLPIDAQMLKLRTIRKEVAKALLEVKHGVDSEDVVISVLDLVAVVRRVVELSGYGPGPLRTKLSVMPSCKKPAAIASRTPASATAALKDVRVAIEMDPDCTDGLGNRIEPLTKHVARLLKAHEEASQMARAEERDALDAQLDEAMGFVSAAAKQAMDLHHRGRLQRFGTEMSFIRTRHDPGPLTPVSQEARQD